MKRILSIFTTSVLVMLCAVPSYGQGYMATKLRIDSVKPYTFHGTAYVGAKVEQSDCFTVQVEGGLECMVPFKKHKLRFAGKMNFNTYNKFDNGNRGYAFIAGDFYQYHIDEKLKIREKNIVFFSAIGGAQYDFCRDLHCRIFTGMVAIFQPLRKHPHLCLEPGVGFLMDFSYWNALAGADRASLQTFLASGTELHLISMLWRLNLLRPHFKKIILRQSSQQCSSTFSIRSGCRLLL